MEYTPKSLEKQAKIGFYKTAGLPLKSASLQTSIRKPAVEQQQACGLIPQGYRMQKGCVPYLF
ncbi:MAG: hypothetical protein KBA86_00315 [Bacteroidales bacterium]|nr:hypothetical protein [Bacteroidales bacterium]